MEKTGRNDPCNCNSGKKFKKCCGLRNPKIFLENAQNLTGPNKIGSLFQKYLSVTKLNEISPEIPSSQVQSDI